MHCKTKVVVLDLGSTCKAHTCRILILYAEFAYDIEIHTVLVSCYVFRHKAAELWRTCLSKTTLNATELHITNRSTDNA